MPEKGTNIPDYICYSLYIILDMDDTFMLNPNVLILDFLDSRGGNPAIEGTAGLPATAVGAFLPDRARDAQYGGTLDPVLDNPGRIPGKIVPGNPEFATAGKL